MLNHSPVGGCCGDSLVYSCSGARCKQIWTGVFLAIRKLSKPVVDERRDYGKLRFYRVRVTALFPKMQL
jgi:hypothetical protein